MNLCAKIIDLRDNFHGFVRDIQRVKKLVSGYEPTYEEYIANRFTRQMLGVAAKIYFKEILRRSDADFISGRDWLSIGDTIRIRKPIKFNRLGGEA